MTLLPTYSHLTDSARTKAEAKADIGAMRDVIAELGGHEAWTATAATLTIASGSITPAAAGFDFYLVETEGAASSDYLTTIATTNRPEGRAIVIAAKTAGHTVIVDHAAGNLYLATDVDFTLDATDKFLLLRRVGSNWIEVGRCWGADKTGAEFVAFQGHGTAAALNVGTGANQIVQLDGSAKLPAVDGSQLTGLRQRGLYTKIVEYTAYNVAAGNALADTWNKRNLNDKSTHGCDEIGVTLGSGQVTLGAGTYYFYASAPAIGVHTHKISLYETTASIARIHGSTTLAGVDELAQTTSVACGKFTIATGTKIFELQHYTLFAATNGLGAAVGDSTAGDNIHAVLELWKV